MMKAELAQLLTSGLVQGKSSIELARHLSKRFGVSKTNAERLMVTELRRVQTEAARQSYIKNGVAEYTFLTANAKGPCDECRALDYKHFKVKDMKVGVNAPPMHPRCHCTTAPYEDEKDYQEWLDFFEKGGTTKEWNRIKGNSNSISSDYMTGGKKYSPYDQNDKKDVAAAKEYKKISKRNDVADISKNSGFSKEDIIQIKRHIFYNKHQKYDDYGIFYPDYDMAVAWKRLYEGTAKERDILLLNHELLESTLEKEYNLTIADAHKEAQKKYDWASRLLEETEGKGESYGIL